MHLCVNLTSAMYLAHVLRRHPARCDTIIATKIARWFTLAFCREKSRIYPDLTITAAVALGAQPWRLWIKARAGQCSYVCSSIELPR
jgi:hypothetical protein